MDLGFSRWRSCSGSQPTPRCDCPARPPGRSLGSCRPRHHHRAARGRVGPLSWLRSALLQRPQPLHANPGGLARRRHAGRHRGRRPPLPLCRKWLLGKAALADGGQRLVRAPSREPAIDATMPASPRRSAFAHAMRGGHPLGLAGNRSRPCGPLRLGREAVPRRSRRGSRKPRRRGPRQSRSDRAMLSSERGLWRRDRARPAHGRERGREGAAPNRRRPWRIAEQAACMLIIPLRSLSMAAHMPAGIAAADRM
ncbi:hypothetical protein SAMN04487843_13149 [Methylobacterium sp. ap11]|nr:hypothetical protein SAMN04487843_13149 [Methylobacterium sp. ap11]